ncbi:MAG: heat-inducible transcription repressor HrcA [Bryobacteraceae bacterium]|nr:heat-inducible transcription repressor HrcA [Bryobacteraceae bacterium]
MSGLTPLSSRHTEILNSIVQTYVQTGRPVPSGSLARLGRHRLSPASIRNAMADLADAGYLSQPHTSAGRIPTEKAFQVFVRSLSVKRVIERELEILRRKLAEAGTVAARVERSTQMLVEMTHGFSIAAAIFTEAQKLDQVELLGLSDGRILMIVVTRDKVVRSRVVNLDEPVSQDELNSIRNYINASYSGFDLSEVRSQLKARLEQASAAYDSILRKLILLYDKGLLEIGLDPEVHMEGAANLVGVDFHLTREKMRELFRALEEKKRVLMLLERFLEDSDGDVSVQVGLGEAHPGMKELSLIGVSVSAAGGLNAKIAVIGPLRMNYPKAISAVLHVGQAFRSVAP